jgi:hypothetical protein
VSSVSFNKLCSPDIRSSVLIAASSGFRSAGHDKVFRPPSPFSSHFRPPALHKGHFTTPAGVIVSATPALKLMLRCSSPRPLCHHVTSPTCPDATAARDWNAK